VRVQYAPGRDVPYWKRHLSYLVKVGKGKDGGPGRYFSAADRPFDREAFETRLWHDPWAFSVIVSPGQSWADRLDMEELGRTFMLSVERHLGKKLAWVGVAHFDTDERHCHFVWSGRTLGGQVYRLRRQTISYELRTLADTVEGWYTA